MKNVTEFQSFALTKGLAAKTALAGAGKTPEEILAGLGETFKLEGEKLKYFSAAIDVASQNTQNLRRVLVVSLAEGETAPPKAVQVEEHYYVSEFLNLTSAKPEAASERKGGNRRGGKKGDGPKGSPWGMSPEEKAAKNKPAAAKTPAK